MYIFTSHKFTTRRLILLVSVSMDIDKQPSTVSTDDVLLGALYVFVVLVESRLHQRNAERCFRFVTVGVKLDSSEIVENECGAMAIEDRTQLMSYLRS